MPLSREDAVRFEKARVYFERNPGVRKWSRKENGLGHSFIKVENQIYLLHGAIGNGSSAVAKCAFAQNGDMYAVRIAFVERDEPSSATVIAKQVGLIKETMVRDSAGTQKRGIKEKNPRFQKKEYQIQKLGQELAAYLKEGQLTEFQQFLLANQLILALIKLHEAGIAHLDIKPWNIIVDQQGKPDFIDFEFSRPGDPFIEKYRAEVCGTPGYVPQNVRNYNFAALDVYALLKTLYFRQDVATYQGLLPCVLSERFSPFFERFYNNLSSNPIYPFCEAFLEDFLPLPEIVIHQNLRWLLLRGSLELFVERKDSSATMHDIYQKTLKLIQERHAFPEDFYREWDNSKKMNFLETYSELYYPAYHIGKFRTQFLRDHLNNMDTVESKNSLRNCVEKESRWRELSRSYSLSEPENYTIEDLDRFLEGYDAVMSFFPSERLFFMDIKPLENMVKALHNHIFVSKNTEFFDINEAFLHHLLGSVFNDSDILNRENCSRILDRIKLFAGEEFFALFSTILAPANLSGLRITTVAQFKSKFSETVQGAQRLFCQMKMACDVYHPEETQTDRSSQFFPGASEETRLFQGLNALIRNKKPTTMNLVELMQFQEAAGRLMNESVKLGGKSTTLESVLHRWAEKTGNLSIFLDAPATAAAAAAAAPPRPSGLK